MHGAPWRKNRPFLRAGEIRSVKSQESYCWPPERTMRLVSNAPGVAAGILTRDHLVLILVLVSISTQSAAFSTDCSSASCRRTTPSCVRRRRALPPATTRHQRVWTRSSSAPRSSLSAQIFVDLANEYNYLTTTVPLPTQSATFGTFAGVGDVLAQKTSGNPPTVPADQPAAAPTSKDFDGKRTQRFVLKGLGAGLIWSQWYPLVDGWSDVTTSYVLADLAIENAGAAHTIAKTASSILMEQFLACPIVYSLWDIPVPALLAGSPPSEIPGMVRRKVPGLLLDNAKVWTVANVVVYNLPVQWRVFAVSVAEIFWASIVSNVATAGSSSTAFIEAQDNMIDMMAEEKLGKVEALGSSKRSR